MQLVSIQLSIVLCTTYPEKSVSDSVIASLLLLSVVEDPGPIRCPIHSGQTAAFISMCCACLNASMLSVESVEFYFVLTYIFLPLLATAVE